MTLINSNTADSEAPTERFPADWQQMKNAGERKHEREPRAAGDDAKKGAAPLSTAPSLGKEQIRLLRSTFTQIEKKAGLAALDFYRNLFNLDPTLRPLFQSDIELQGRKLMQALSYTIQTLENPEALTPVLEALGRRHVTYGARDCHYDTVIEALMRTLPEFLGSDFTAPTADAWRAALTHVAATMKRGAAQVIPVAK